MSARREAGADDVGGGGGRADAPSVGDSGEASREGTYLPDGRGVHVRRARLGDDRRGRHARARGASRRRVGGGEDPPRAREGSGRTASPQQSRRPPRTTAVCESASSNLIDDGAKSPRSVARARRWDQSTKGGLPVFSTSSASSDVERKTPLRLSHPDRAPGRGSTLRAGRLCAFPSVAFRADSARCRTRSRTRRPRRAPGRAAT